MILQENPIILAPMEGVIDAFMRELLTEINDYDHCVTEFVRVVKGLIPKHMYKRICPELLTDGKTASGTPVRVQLLGQHPQWLAENAVRAIELGSPGIDLNFGCPAPTVNKSKGGAMLLKTPETIYQIIATCREAVPDDLPVSAKIRLGWEDTSQFEEIIDAVASANASSLAIHARTKKQGYKAPAHWHYIRQASQRLAIPVIANGEIWQRSDALSCMTASNTSSLMLGRGALATPNLANVIKYNEPPLSNKALVEFIINFCHNVPQGVKTHYLSSRLKQWLKYVRLQYPIAQQLFDELKYLHDTNDILRCLDRYLDIADN
ncbi:tRNA-dihydrouridine synthase [Thalassotalea sp. LPB0316]|uniref:tRNA-dihydrouridine synthase n=1 Tax=Thalassotalea sp. LPB0316 TaxID=2769490 RepID=UPI00186646B3|nr:tRNA-dihydrouridine synthase [Thalassotalea sp. LPB0316]QOL27165.1 tRNA-dihydrouridine synthase [Thalassotalea sp. LPB0316]